MDRPTTSFQLQTYVSAQGYQVQPLTIKIGCLGHYTHEAYTALRLAAPQSKASDRRKALTGVAKAAISGTYTIFSAHKSPWNLGAMHTNLVFFMLCLMHCTHVAPPSPYIIHLLLAHSSKL